jgi:hypothetical protein
MKSIDHYVALVEDQEASRAAFLRLGFNVRPTAKHIELGSTNAVVIFPNSYLELLCLDGAREDLRVQYIDRLKAGPGLCHVSLTADSLAAEHARLTALGYTPGPEGNARRKVILPGGAEGETDSSFLYNWKTPHRFLSLFFSEHRKRDMIFIEGHTHHPNGAIDTARIVGVSEDPALDLDYYAQSWGQPAEDRAPAGFLMRGGRGDIVEVLTPAAAQSRYGAALDGPGLGGLGGLPVALHFGTRDLAATRALLVDNGVPVVEAAGGIAVPRAEAEGMVVVFEQA